MATSGQRAAPPTAPAATRELAQLEAHHREGEQTERHRQLRGLLMLALVVLAFSLARAGLGRVFPHGWWRLW